MGGRARRVEPAEDGEQTVRVYLWAGGVYFNIRSDGARQCILVIIGVTEHGWKEFIAIEDGYRESVHSWSELLLLIKAQGLGAIRYALSQWPRLLVYFDEPLLTSDNNLAENAIRPFVLGRKNWLFAWTVQGAEASVSLYSLIDQNCQGQQLRTVLLPPPCLHLTCPWSAPWLTSRPCFPASLERRQGGSCCRAWDWEIVLTCHQC